MYPGGVLQPEWVEGRCTQGGIHGHIHQDTYPPWYLEGGYPTIPTMYLGGYPAIPTMVYTLRYIPSIASLWYIPSIASLWYIPSYASLLYPCVTVSYAPYVTVSAIIDRFRQESRLRRVHSAHSPHLQT